MSTEAVIHGATQVVEIDDTGLQTHADAGVAVVDGAVAAVDDSRTIVRSYPPENADHAIDATGQTVMPGFVDPHTHAVFAGDRSDEFAAKLRGKSYQAIANEGGGIQRTVRATRDASAGKLLETLLERLDAMLAHGTTTVEVKSGYGLDVEMEKRLVDVIARADARHPVDVVVTFMGAHAVPPGTETAAYVDEVVAEQIPAVADHGVATFCDVFCEDGYFSVEQSRRILDAGRKHGMVPKVHAEELTRLGGAKLAADVGATSADHLLHATAADAAALAEAGVVPVLLPGTAFSLGADYADPTVFRAAGAPPAVATDFNPNCHSVSMSFTTTLACIGMGMTPDQAIVAATREAAAAVDRPDRGRLTENGPADLIVVDAPNYLHVPYQFGMNLVSSVLKDGAVVYRAASDDHHERG